MPGTLSNPQMQLTGRVRFYESRSFVRRPTSKYVQLHLTGRRVAGS